jgi:drug/metabolite transporter (DMT)-like permease
MDILGSYLGETLSLLTAIAWAFAVILFKKSGETVHPLGLNLFKNLLSMTLLVPTAYLFGESIIRDVPAHEYLLLLASGALGIGVADTLFFKSLNALGAGLTAIVDCAYAPVIIILSVIWLGESLSPWQLSGVLLIVTAVLMTGGDNHSGSPSRRHVMKGVAYGLSAMVANGIGIVMIKPLLERSPIFWVTEVRLAGGVIVVLTVLAFHSSRRAIIQSILSAHSWGYTVSSSFVGAYLSMLLWLGGMKFAQASVAAALNQTSNLIIFVLAALILKEKLTSMRILAILLGVGGAFLVTFA